MQTAKSSHRCIPERGIGNCLSTVAFAVALALGQFGCLATAPSQVSLSATAIHGQHSPRKFVVLPGPGITPRSDFENVSNVFVFSLIAEGYSLATLSDTELVIGIDYRPSSSSRTTTSTVPVYGTVPGPVSLINLTSYPTRSPSGTITTTGTVLNVPKTAVVGQETISKTEVTTRLDASIGAYDAKQFRQFAQTGLGSPPPLLWRIDVSANVGENTPVSEVASDLMRAAAKYAGKNTGGLVSFPVVRSRLGSPE